MKGPRECLPHDFTAVPVFDYTIFVFQTMWYVGTEPIAKDTYIIHTTSGNQSKTVYYFACGSLILSEVPIILY